jgi:hypothetical protein
VRTAIGQSNESGIQNVRHNLHQRAVFALWKILPQHQIVISNGFRHSEELPWGNNQHQRTIRRHSQSKRTQYSFRKFLSLGTLQSPTERPTSQSASHSGRSIPVTIDVTSLLVLFHGSKTPVRLPAMAGRCNCIHNHRNLRDETVYTVPVIGMERFSDCKDSPEANLISASEKRYR